MKSRALSTEERSRLESVIGHEFAVKERLDRAVTHSSTLAAKGGNYERLEFLGDRVLGLCVAELLFETFKTADEGELSVRLNRTGADIKKLTDKRMLNVRADVVESLIGALYLDAGLEAARGFILRNWKDRATRADGAKRDAKTELQEWAHAKYSVTPVYRVDDRSGPDHEPRFTVTVQVTGIAPETGIDRSKRAAEQVAAAKLLQRMGVWEKISDDTP